VSVTVRNGVVSLRGIAANPRQAELARLIAYNTCGVKRVSSELRTIPKP